MRSRTSKASVVLLAAILVVLLRGTRRQRRLFRALNLFGLRYPGEDVVSAIGGFFGGIGSSVRGYVEAVIKTVADALQSGIDWVLSVARAAAQYAQDLFHLAVDTAASFANEVRSYATDVYNAAIGFGNAVLSRAIDWANSVGRWAVDTATDLFHQALDWTTTFGRWVLDAASSLARSLFDAANDLIHTAIGGVVDFARSLFNTAADFARSLFNTANDLIHAAAGAALDFARSLFDTANRLLADGLSALRDGVLTVIDDVQTVIGDQISTVNDYLFGTVSSIIDVVTTILDWLIGLAEFPFTTARDMWGAMRDTGGRTIFDHMPGTVDRWGDHIRDHATANVDARAKGFVLAPLPDHGTPRSSGGGGGGTGVPGTGTPDIAAFALAVLAGLGAPASEGNLRFLSAWFARENTAASYNPLATTLDYGSNTRFNAVGVRNYQDFATGVAATINTLLHSGYPGIVADLLAGDGRAAGQQHGELSRWSGHSYDTINV